MLMNGPPDTVKDDIDAKERLEKRVSQREEELCDLFRVFDTDGSGFISAEEISRIMTKFSGLTPEEAQILLNEADIDRDGEVCVLFHLKNIIKLERIKEMIFIIDFWILDCYQYISGSLRRICQYDETSR